MTKIKLKELKGLDRHIMRTRPDLVDLKERGGVWLLPNSNNYKKPEPQEEEETTETAGDDPPPITARRIDSATEIKES